MKHHIHRYIAKNLLLSSGLIFLLTVAAVLTLEFKRTERHINRLATEESLKYVGYYEAYFVDQRQFGLSKLEETVSHSLDDKLFVLIELYDKDLVKIVDASTSEIRSYKIYLEQRFPKFSMKQRIDNKTVYYNGQLFTKVMAPIRIGEQNAIIGHFEGIYRLSDHEMQEIQYRFIFSFIQSIVVVVFASLALYPIIVFLNRNLLKKSNDLLEANINTLKSLGNAVAKRDSDTNSHNYRVSIYAIRLAEQWGLKNGQIRDLIKGAFLHDIGKIGISDRILLKPGVLTEQEFIVMQQHVTLGAEIIQNNKWLTAAEEVILFHHEKFDGSGYNLGLKGDDIPINARIFAIVDVFDALTSRRPYKEPFSLDKTLSIMRANVGNHFDPSIFGVFELIVEALYTEIAKMEDEEVLSQNLDKYLSRYFEYS